MIPVIDKEKCTGCEDCVEVCPPQAIEMEDGKAVIDERLCEECGECVPECPEKAITETGRELGVIERGHRNGLEFVHGRLRIGEAMSPPLIRKVREYTLPGTLTIIDAPPGTSCPVISSMKGADFVLLVTEPTPFGLYDLKLAIGAVNILGLPCGLVINRSDIGDDQVKVCAQKEDVPVLMEIPFDRWIAEAYSRGEMLVDVIPEWKQEFKGLYNRIEKIAG